MITLEIFLSIETTLFGLASSIAFIIGTLSLSSNAIHNITSTRYSHNKYASDSLIAQKAQYVIGAFFLALSFSFLGLKYIYSEEQLHLPLKHVSGELLLSILTILFIMCVYILLNKVIKDFTKVQVAQLVEKGIEERNRKS
jgi:TRAP-type C4-dicarboxylate transport system permease small subunit